jgi:rhodanese-related sulfurtransferase
MPAALLGFAIATLIVGAIATRFHHDVIRVYEARDRLRRPGAVLLDVDSAGEFAKRHPELARNIPLAELEMRAREIGAPDTPVVVYARRWRDGANAVHVLRALGFSDVFDAAGATTKQELSAAAARAETARARGRRERGVPDELELVTRAQ